MTLIAKGKTNNAVGKSSGHHPIQITQVDFIKKETYYFKPSD